MIVSELTSATGWRIACERKRIERFEGRCRKEVQYVMDTLSNFLIIGFTV